jgi:hypothetical protein
MGSVTDAGCQLVPEPDSGDGSDEEFILALMSIPGISMPDMFMPGIFGSEFWAVASNAKNDQAAIKRHAIFLLTH